MKAVEAWMTYFAGHVTEARHRRARRALGSAEYVLLRRQVVGADPTLNQFLVNDVQSVQKEERKGS
ncbi:hypothetical protein GCM10020221_05950 [Streptomyces thioluteus]|uniref:Uncharacterized protein n=2 Tax=Streptomyces thioluteus TaxID=66431 RepID=A0ABN3WEE6_STRTU